MEPSAEDQPRLSRANVFRLVVFLIVLVVFVLPAHDAPKNATPRDWPGYDTVLSALFFASVVNALVARWQRSPLAPVAAWSAVWMGVLLTWSFLW
jgi:hypothetical protein